MLIIRKRWAHMGLHSGSDLLFESISKSIPVSNVFVNQATVPPKGVLRRILERLQIVSRSNLWSFQLSAINGIREVYAMQLAIEELEKDLDLTLFVSCGEEQLTKHLINLGTETRKRIFVLLHQPPSWYEKEVGFIDHLNGLGGVFVFSKLMRDYFDSIIDSPVYAIYHGVDYGFFNPGHNPTSHDSKSIICVGNWYRDFELLNECWSRLTQFDQDLQLTLIASNEALKNEYFQVLVKKPNVYHKVGLSSVQLLDAYQQACLHMLPLADGVANNALVESLATACPLVVSDVGSTREYLPSNHSGLARKGDVEDHFNKSVNLLTDSKLRNELALKQRAFATADLSWSAISEQVLKAIS